MKKLLVLIFCFIPLFLFAQVQQQGIVRLKSNRYGEKIKPIEGVIVTAYKANTVKSDNSGKFVLVFSGKHYADSITIFEIKKQGYELSSAYLLRKGAWNLSPKNTLEIVLIKTIDRIREQNQIERNIRNQLKQDFDKNIQVLENELQEQKITIDIYQKKYTDLLEKYENTTWVSEEAERLSRCDYATLDSMQAKIIDLRKQGRGNELVEISKQNISNPVLLKLNENPSFIAENIRNQKEKLQQEQKYSLFIAEQILNIADGFRLQNNYDSVEHYLRLRADIDKYNFDYQYDYAKFLFQQRAYTKLDAFLRKCLAIPNLSNDQNGELNFLMAQLFYTHNKFDKAETAYQKSIECFEKSLLPNKEQKKANSQKELGYLYKKQNKNDLAIQNFDQAIMVYRKQNNEDNSLFIRELCIVLGYKADLLTAQHDFENAEKLYLESLECCSKIPSQEIASYEQAFKYQGLGNLYLTSNNYPSALKCFRANMQNIETLYSQNPDAYCLDYVKALESFAYIEMLSKNADTAEFIYKKTINLLVKMSKTNPNTYNKYFAEAYNGYANFLGGQTRYVEAETNYKKSIDIWKSLVKQNADAYNHYLAMALNNLAWMYTSQKHWEQADTIFTEAIKIYRILCKTNPNAYSIFLARTINNAAMVHECQKKYSLAEKEYNEVLSIYKKNIKHDQSLLPYMAITFNNLGKLYEFVEKTPKAEKSYKEALTIFLNLNKTTPEYYDYYLAIVYTNLGTLQIQEKEWTDAKINVLAAKDILQKLVDKNFEHYSEDFAKVLNLLLQIYDNEQDIKGGQEVKKLLEKYKLNK